MTKSVSSLHQYKIDSFFAGVGGIELGFEQTNEFRVVYANEFDKSARITYSLNNPDIPLDGRDIHDVNPIEIPDCDVIVGGFPCQAFSIAGYQKGFEDDRGDLFFELLKMIKAKNPQVIFIENVKNLVTHDHGNTFKVIREALVMNGYSIKWKVLNSKDYGNTPQNRERIYIVGFKNHNLYKKFQFPEEIELTKTIHDVVDFEKKKDEKYYYRSGKQPFYDKLVPEIVSHDTAYQWRRQYVRENKNNVIPTLTANMGTGGHNVPLIYTYSNEIRKLTPKETFNAQGYPSDFKLPNISNGQLYKQAGNSVTVPVISRIAQNILKVLNNSKLKEDNFENLSKQKKYALIYVDMNGKFEGKTTVKCYFDEKENIYDYLHDKVILTDDEYLKVVRNNKKASFYMIKRVEL